MRSKLKDNFLKYYNPSIRIFVGLVFFISGILKIIDIPTFKSALIALDLFNPLISNLLSYIIPLVEIVLGLLLLTGLFIRFAAIHTNLLILLFSWVTFYAIRYKEDLSCGCFGSFIDLSFNKFHLIFLFILFILNIVITLEVKEIWSLEKIIKEKLPKSKKIKLFEILIYILIVFGIILILFSLYVNFKALKRETIDQSLVETKEEVIVEDEEISKIIPISVDEAFEAYNSNKDYIFLDVRSLEEYQKVHIKGAKLIPVSQIKDRLNELPKGKSIIVYCDGSSCSRSGNAANILVEHGFKEVYDMTGGGIIEWGEKGYPISEGNTS
ncbi:MAG: rhodanese-like domain-containing protein [Candidatus Atribacteria bacterium]|nr:MAG: rhodanese-like domain-containing protein [Candidatus Atribacteria bacterium]